MCQRLRANILIVVGIVSVVLLLAATSLAVDDEAWAVFEGKKDRVVEIRATSGLVVVTGTNSDTVHVRARRTDLKEAEETVDSDDPRAAGLRKITHSATGLEVWGDGNVVMVATRDFGASVDLYVRMPRTAALEISGHFADSILVRNITAPVDVRTNGSAQLENVDGEIEVETAGWIYLTDVAGSVVCNSGFGGIEGTVKRLSADRPVSLSAMGPIDVAIPRNSKATLYMKTSFGEVYTDFDVELQRNKDWPDDTDISIPFVTMLPPKAPKMPKPIVVVEPRPVKPPKPDKPGEAKKSEEAEKAEKETRSMEEYDAAVRAYLYAHREQLRAQRDELREQVREQRADHDKLLPLKRGIAVDVVPFVSPTLSPGLIGEINGGGVEIRLTSMTGSIYVRRGK
jgi:hypothetical protein